jgi:putative peptidoglycan lipid II flippase
VPSAVGVVLLARPLVQLVLQRGSFTAADTALTAEMLQGFAVGLPAFAVYLFVVRAFYARRDTRTPFWLNLTQNILNVAIMFPLTAALDAAGLALAYSLSYWVIVVAALVALHRAVRRDGGEEPGALLGSAGLTALARSVAVGAAVTVALVATFEILRPASEDRALLEVAVGLAVGLAAFVGATFLLRPSGFEPAVDRLRRGWRSRGRSMSN